MIGITKSRGTSIIDLPVKYADVVYSFEFSSLKNTALSTGNEITGRHKMIYTKEK